MMLQLATAPLGTIQNLIRISRYTKVFSIKYRSFHGKQTLFAVNLQRHQKFNSTYKNVRVALQWCMIHIVRETYLYCAYIFRQHFSVYCEMFCFLWRFTGWNSRCNTWALLWKNVFTLNAVYCFVSFQPSVKAFTCLFLLAWFLSAYDIFVWIDSFLSR